MRFNERFKQTCKKNGISPTALLQTLNISTSKLTAWNNGSMPNSEFLIPISEYLGVSIDYLLTGKECKTNLTERETRCLTAFNNLTPEDQSEFIGRMEQRYEDYSPENKEVV